MIKQQLTKIAKAILLPLPFLAGFSTTTKAQSRDATSISLITGYQVRSGFSFGIEMRNINSSPVGVYIQSQLANSLFWGGPEQRNKHFNSAFGWTTTYDTVVNKRKSYGTTGGVTLNIGKLLGKRNAGVTLMLGGGVIIPSPVEYKYRSTRHYNNTLLTPSDEYYYEIKKERSRFAGEIMLAYDFVKDGRGAFSIYSGYNSGGGLQFGLILGFHAKD